MSTTPGGGAGHIGAGPGGGGSRFSDAPVSGGEGGAIAGTPSIMVGGSAAGFATAQPAFAAMGKNIVHGAFRRPGGQGGQPDRHRHGRPGGESRAFAFAAKNGVDGARVRKPSWGFAYSKILENHGQRMLGRNFKPGFQELDARKDRPISSCRPPTNSASAPPAQRHRPDVQRHGRLRGARTIPSPCSSSSNGCRARPREVGFIGLGVMGPHGRSSAPRPGTPLAVCLGG